MNQELHKIVLQFKIEGKIVNISRYGDGLVNDTFLVKTINKNSPDYILQRINGVVFKNIPGLLHNKITVSNHIKAKLKASGVENFFQQALEFVSTFNNKYYVIDNNKNYWNLSLQIPDSITYNKVENESLAYEGGKAIGEFQYFLSDLEVKNLEESFPNFHNLSFRIDQLYSATEKNNSNRLHEVIHEIELVEKYKNVLLEIDELVKNKKIPIRAVHYDTKISNVLFNNNDKAICMIDLDTVMPGVSIFDFGDAIRSGANTGKEDDLDLENVSLNLNYFEKYAQGYLEKTKLFLTKIEIENLVLSALYITFEQFTRFLTDYINGDIYYKTNYENHNLIRAKAQFKLFKSMHENFLKMKNIVSDIC